MCALTKKIDCADELLENVEKIIGLADPFKYKLDGRVNSSEQE